MDSSSDSGSYSVSQGDAWSTYHSAEALAESDHGMQYIGGIGGFWTDPVSGNPAEAAQLMQISADLRCQSAVHKGGNPDPGHLSSFLAAQESAHRISSGNYVIPTIQSSIGSYSNCSGGGSSSQRPVMNFAYINGLVGEKESLERQIESLEQQIKYKRGLSDFDEISRLSDLLLGCIQKLTNVKVNINRYNTGQPPI
jgi:hypothetical protein